MSSHSFQQIVSSRTHTSGNTLDLIFISTENTTTFTLGPINHVISDHYAVPLTMHYSKLQAYPLKVINHRDLSQINSLDFSRDLMNITQHTFTDITIEILQSHLTNLLNQHATLKIKRYKDNNYDNKWFNQTTLSFKKVMRKAERYFSKNPSENSLLLFKQARTNLKKSIITAKVSYYQRKIYNCGNSTKLLYKFTNDLMRKSKKINLPNPPPQHLSELFSSFFINKIHVIHQTILNQLNQQITHTICSTYTPSTITTLSSFIYPTTQDIEHLILLSKSSSPLEHIPLSLMKKVSPLLAKYFYEIIYTSFMKAHVPSILKHALVIPILKKSNLDKNSLCNYRPISQLSTISKIIEKVVFKQLINYLDDNNLIDSYQSAYRPCHSTETLLNHLINNILVSLDAHSPTQLLILDLSAAFDTLNHNILINRLLEIGINGMALDWLISFFTNRTFAVKTGTSSSRIKKINTGVPQVSVLGPILFLIYIAPLTNIIKSYPSLHYHLYADDILSYTHISRYSTSNRSDLSTCATSVRKWLLENMLLLNASKSELLNLPSSYDQFPVITIDGIVIEPSNEIRYLGVTLDRDLTFKSHITNISKKANQQLYFISHIRKFINQDLCRTLMSSLALSQIDYCCSALQGLPESRLRPINRVIRASVRTIFRLSRSDHTSISQLMQNIGFFNMKQRSLYRTLCIIHKSIIYRRPYYIINMISPRTISRKLRSTSDNYLLSIPRYHLECTSTRAFMCSAPTIWNKLPFYLLKLAFHNTFKFKLKTYILCH